MWPHTFRQGLFITFAKSFPNNSVNKLKLQVFCKYNLLKMPSGKTTNVRIKDIAFKAKVSTGTVDRVLHSRGRVSEEVKERVLKILKELNYEPNLMARMLGSKKQYVFA